MRSRSEHLLKNLRFSIIIIYYFNNGDEIYTV
jgi:hypothetical protein